MRNHGLAQINASTAYAAGTSGDGITVAVIDTGIDLDHSDFAGAISPFSTDIVTGSTDFLNDEDGHGTAVAGVIGARRNDLGSHGVAFESTILAVRADAPGSCASGCAFEQADIAAATDYAVTNGAMVINYSLGGASEMEHLLIDSMTRAVDSGIILVIAAGNGGENELTLLGRFASEARAQGRAIAVGAVDANNHLASFSDRAGSARHSYLVAPGTEISTAALDGGFTLASGTSFAAAHVSGAAALLLEAAPFLDAGDVVSILLESATDLGAPGTDPIYGRGLLNLAAALSPQGTLSVPIGYTIEGPVAPLGSTKVLLGAAFGPGPNLGRAIFLDVYGRPYWFALDDRTSTKTSGPGLLPWLSPEPSILRLSAPFGAELALNSGITVSQPAIFSDHPAGLAKPASNQAFALDAAAGPEARMTLSYGLGLQGAFNSAARLERSAHALLTNAQLLSPYLALADAGTGLALAQEFAGGWQIRLGLVSEQKKDWGGFQRGPTTVFVGELKKYWPRNAQVGLQFGRLNEEGGLLETTGDGALRMPSKATTRFIGLGGRLFIRDGVSLFGQTSLGWTDPSTTNQSLIRKVSGVQSVNFGSGISADDLLFDNDNLAIMVSQPLRVVRGTAVIDRPISRGIDGRIERDVDQTSLVPKGQEIDLEFSYRLPVGQRRELSINWLSQFEPGHDQEAPLAHAVALRLRAEF